MTPPGTPPNIPPEIVVQPVILCGGSGTRLWPLSRAGFPRQFLCLTGDESLFQLREDLKAAERDEPIKKHGFKAMAYHG